jgi:O-antigen/teichoic acid export membrane protein
VYVKLRAKLAQLLTLGAFSTLALMAILPFLIPAAYSSKYATSVLPAELLAISVLLSPLGQVLTSALVSRKRVKELYYLRTLIPGFRMAFLVLLIPSFGVLGAALSVLFSRLIGVAYAWYAVKNIAREKQVNSHDNEL